MGEGISAYLHLGETYVRRFLPHLPVVGQIIYASPLGRLMVVKVEHDAEGAPHVHLDAIDPKALARFTRLA